MGKKVFSGRLPLNAGRAIRSSGFRLHSAKHLNKSAVLQNGFAAATIPDALKNAHLAARKLQE